MKKRKFALGSLTAAGMIVPGAAAFSPSSNELPDTQDGDIALYDVFTLPHEYTLAQHRSHRSHSSHRSSSSGSSRPRSTPAPAPRSNSTPPSSVLPSNSTAPKVLPGNTAKFKRIVTQVQSGLFSYGYYTGTIDCLMGPETKAAISKFQSDFSINVTGTITPEVLNALGITAN